MRWADPDHILPAGEIAGLLNRLAGEHRIERKAAGNPSVRSPGPGGPGRPIGIPRRHPGGATSRRSRP
jgi:hypothetical protein